MRSTLKIIAFALLGSLVLCSSMLASLHAAESVVDAAQTPSLLSLPRPVDAPPASVQPVTTPPPTLSQLVASKLTIAEMGQPAGLTLSSWQSQSGINFTLPNDAVVTTANLLLDVEVSPALMESDTELYLMLNGQPVSQHPLNKLHKAQSSYQVSIPPAMVVAHNNLSFSIQSAGNTPMAMQCEKGVANKYWLKVLPSSELQLESQELNIGQNLGRFPRPFFDPQAMQPAVVSMVFSPTKRPEDVAAAAIVSSHLGVVTHHDNLDFQVLEDVLPERNGIIFGRPGEQIGDLRLPQADGPMLKVIDNPANPLYKLLLVIGNNSNEMRQAAYRLVSQPLPEKTPLLAVKPVNIPKRLAYDAPRWINTNRPVKFSELVADVDQLTANGVYSDAVRVAFRAAPDLFIWDGKTLPLRINYRFPADSWMDERQSQLSATLNGTFLRNLSVNKNGLLDLAWRALGGDTRQESYNLSLPLYLIYGDNMLEFYFSIVPKNNISCNVPDGDNIKSHIDPDSYIDLSKSYHFDELPNLAYYVGATFPFSKLADFSQTVLLLAEKPTLNEIHTLLNLAERAGRATGSAISNAEVRFGLKGKEVDADQFQARDVLVVASLAQSGLYQRLLQDAPFAVNNSRILTVKPQPTAQRLKSYLRGNWHTEAVDADRYLSSLSDWRGFFSFRSAWDPQRVVVVATASDDEGLSKIHTDLKSTQINAGVRGDLAVINDQDGVNSFQVSAQFPSGELPWYLVFIWYASKYVVVLCLAVLAVSVVLGLSLYVLLRKHAARRLGRDAEDES
jgi:hypothetical protein